MPILGSIIKKAYELRKIPIDQKQRKHTDPYLTQVKELRKLLKKSQFTYFGEHYGFSELLSGNDVIKRFQSKVPVYDYNSMFRKWWYRALNGESFVSWPGRVKYFALTSGTSEASSKQIPVTGDMIRAIRRASIRQLVSSVNFDFPIEFYEKGVLMIGGSTHLQYNGTYYEGDLSGISAGNIPFWFQHFYKPGKRISKERDWSTKLDEIIKKAKNWDIGVIVGVPAWIQIILERIIDHYKVETIHDIWPNLSIYVHSGVSFAPYIKSFEKLFAKKVIYQESYLASEGYIAFQNSLKSNAMQLILDNCIFYEFVPFDNINFDEDGNLKPNPTALTIKDVEAGKEYALLMTTCSGAWRYLIGDVIKFVSKENYEIMITGRTKHFLSICGEHLSLDNLSRAIEMLENEMNVEIREFTVAGKKHGSMFAHQWYLGSDDKIDPKEARDKIDGYLKILNDDYRVERIEAIRDVFVEVLPASVFSGWMKMKGKEGGANKFPRVLKKDLLTEWQEYLNNYQISSK
ncbi:MAG: GH3 auxin-responsive promoter family protein [Bacteroidales bacterium]|nr:GH3 auxin-responsive promoter family protein [Bacteroidales bacterium]MCF8403551.1 GH3 auxin-responsive promoter family protein [Bacteroidales bacterium]